MLYVDGLVTVLPAFNIDAYYRLLDEAIPLIRAYGAISVVPCNEEESADQLAAFERHIDDAVVVFSWIIWPSREVRDRGMERMLADPRIDDVMNPASLEGERLELDASLLPRFH
ncbi:DUF1428 domain-containing protein [Enterovibrio paralichthyis]|uniref:DUF1428 domain-containing protein n=1 Tax=Enterovibrio paralichthyis TaxID=2853805 RepID=UPI001C436FEA|nr:DUF1428 domain-containing protein [Enterovibrio paralichthyis]MBV7298457.1 DUF1428 domain-containing protein [Enterovibrio paralichthyis]